MSKLHRMTVATTYATYFAPRFAPNSLIWLQDTQSEVVMIAPCNHERLYRIYFADRTQTIAAHNLTCYIRPLTGMVENGKQ